MWAGVREIGGLITPQWSGLAGGSVAGVLWLLAVRGRARAGQRHRERRIEEEMQAYARLDVRLTADDDSIELAGQVSRLMAEKSAFSRAAVLVRDREGGLSVKGSARMEDSTVELLNVWVKGVVATERNGEMSVRRGDSGLGVRVGARSFAVVLKKMPTGIECQRAIVIPLWTTQGRMLGVLAVGADGVMSVRRSALTKALAPLEALAFKVERAMENAALAKRLQCAEKLAGLGMLAGGVAHALNNPLTAVLGFAELIADTAGENRVKEDAEIIVREAVRMQQTVEMLQEFSQPRAPEKVDVAELVQELAKECAEKLAGRGVRLVVQTGDEVAAVLGNRDRLRQMSEHLLNNAAQALAWMDSAAMGEEKVIRMTVGRNGPMVHLLVSDSGPGFAEPGRVFEPFRMKGRVGDRVGLGLGICYGIVHEHGGEIGAFNLHPHGAAVAVELPVDDFAFKKSETVAGEEAYSVSV